jgi:hypothetical protein
MKTFKMIFVGMVLAVAGVAVAAAAGDAAVGTWKLNSTKSSFTPGPAPQSQTRTYSEDADGTSLSITGVGADGSPISQESTFKYDGKAYSMKGSKDFDALALKQVNGSTVTADLMRSGKHVGTTTRTISGHGKVLTLTTKLTGADGKLYSTVAVFDKQ